MRRTFLLLPLLLAACAGNAVIVQDPARDAGKLNLLAALTIPPGSATLRLQYGHPVARNAVQEQDAFCVFEIDTVSDSPQRVRPDNFRVTRIGHSIENIATLAQPMPMKVGLFGDGRPTFIYYKTLFWLHSERQRGVRVLTCMSNQNMPGVFPFMRHLTLNEIRAALGADFELEVR